MMFVAFLEHLKTYARHVASKFNLIIIELDMLWIAIYDISNSFGIDIIDDSVTANDKTWSSSKISATVNNFNLAIQQQMQSNYAVLEGQINALQSNLDVSTLDVDQAYQNSLLLLDDDSNELTSVLDIELYYEDQAQVPSELSVPDYFNGVLV